MKFMSNYLHVYLRRGGVEACHKNFYHLNVVQGRLLPACVSTDVLTDRV